MCAVFGYKPESSEKIPCMIQGHQDHDFARSKSTQPDVAVSVHLPPIGQVDGQQLGAASIRLEFFGTVLAPHIRLPLEGTMTTMQWVGCRTHGF